MDSAEFFRRFVDGQEIGRDITDTELSIYYDNGTEVGLWRLDRRSTIGTGSVLGPDDAEMARHWFKEGGGKEGGRHWSSGIAAAPPGRQR